MRNGGKPKEMLIFLGFIAFFIVANVGKNYVKIDIFDLKLPMNLPIDCPCYESFLKRSFRAS
jgi:hypothetical protein